MYLKSLSSIKSKIASVFQKIFKRNLSCVWRLKESKILRQNEIFVVKFFIISLICRYSSLVYDEVNIAA